MCARHNFPYTRGWMEMVFYYQMIYFPETDDTIKQSSCYGLFDVTIIIQCTMTLSLCINVAWCCYEPASWDLTHPAMSILLHCLMLTACLFPFLAGRVPRLPRWLPFPQDPHTPFPHRPIQDVCKEIACCIDFFSNWQVSEKTLNIRWSSEKWPMRTPNKNVDGVYRTYFWIGIHH
jgi:hypothetical protein